MSDGNGDLVQLTPKDFNPGDACNPNAEFEE